MSQTFKEFLQASKDKLYRDLIKHHYTKQKLQKLNFNMFATASMISREFESDIESIMDSTAVQFCELIPMIDKKIYDKYTVEEAAIRILKLFIDRSANNPKYKIPDNIKSPEDFFKSENNDELAWNLFQVVTLNLAWMCSKHKPIRKIFGLRKGLFG
jgi:hypothetical protein